MVHNKNSHNHTPSPSAESPTIRKTGSVELTLPADAQQAWQFLRPELHNVEFGSGRPESGTPGLHWKVQVPAGVLVAHVDDDENLTLVRNIRYPLINDGTEGQVDDGASFELPGGGVDPTDAEKLPLVPPEEALRILGRNAIREFEEEIGILLDPNNLTHLHTLQLAVGFSNLKTDTFHATGGISTKQSHDDGEAGMLKVFKVPLQDAHQLVRDGLVREATTVNAISTLENEYGIPVPKRLNLQKHSFSHNRK